jgi:hypothetical protein
MFTGIDQKLVAAIGAALVAAAIVASGASAQVVMPEGTGGSDSASVGYRTPDGYQPQLSTDVPAAIDKVEANRVAPVGGADVSLPQATGTVVGSDDGFAWGTFSLAAGGALGLIALFGAVLIGMRRGRVAHA